jgi:hypothetical protein
VSLIGGVCVSSPKIFMITGKLSAMVPSKSKISVAIMLGAYHNRANFLYNENMPSKNVRQLLTVGLIALHIAVLGAALYSWGFIYGWRWPKTGLDLFPLLGLLAFGLMWIHYVAAATNRFFGGAFNLKNYFDWTGRAVLLLIILHPGIFIYSLWRDGFGLPPSSYLKFVGKSGELAVFMGTAAWLTFILYEFKNKLQKTSFWPVMVGLNDFAMGLIFLHARALGSSLQLTWFRNLWTFYGIVLVLCVAQRLYFVYDRHQKVTATNN